MIPALKVEVAAFRAVKPPAVLRAPVCVALPANVEEPVTRRFWKVPEPIEETAA